MTADPKNSRRSALLQALQAFQAQRIRATYADLYEQPQYTKLVKFFFEEIYGPQDFGMRNEGIKVLHQKLSGLLKGEIIESMGKVVELNDLTETLDEIMVDKMLGQGVGVDFDMETYGVIYQSCDNYEQRVFQINLMLEATKHIYAVSRMWMIGLTLRAVNTAAHLAGYGKIIDFLSHGYEAFRNVKNIDHFLQTVETREKALNNRLFGRA